MNVKSIAERAAHAFGAAHFLRSLHRSRARILMYHRFPGSEAQIREKLTAQCEHLRKYYNPVGLTELVAALQDGRPLPPRSVAITVDDGYGDFAHAFPVFQSFGLQVTLYVVSGFASRELWLWPDQLQFLIENTPVKFLTVSLPGGGTAALDTRTPHSRRQAFDAVCQPLIRAENAERLRMLRDLPASFHLQIPREVPAEFAPLSWDQLRALAVAGLDVGCHTHSHPILSQLQTQAELDTEIAGAKHRIENMLNRPVHNFCYPNGEPTDFNEATVSTVRAAGFLTAVCTERGLVGTHSDVFRLPRLGVEPESPMLYFERLAAGYRAHSPVERLV